MGSVGFPLSFDQFWNWMAHARYPNEPFNFKNAIMTYRVNHYRPTLYHCPLFAMYGMYYFVKIKRVRPARSLLTGKYLHCDYIAIPFIK